MGNNYRLAHIDDKTKTITDIADLSREVESTQMNIKQKNKKQNCVILGFTYSFTLLSGFLCNFKVTFEGLVMEAEKRKKSNHEKQHKE
jgi:hypothetical protein